MFCQFGNIILRNLNCSANFILTVTCLCKLLYKAHKESETVKYFKIVWGLNKIQFNCLILYNLVYVIHNMIRALFISLYIY